MSSLGSVAVLVSLTATSMRAQAPVTPLTPSPPHEALTFFEGSWTVAEQPAEQQMMETCAWLNAGRRHMVCRSTWRRRVSARGWP